MKQVFSLLVLSCCIAALILSTVARAQQTRQMYGLTWTIAKTDNIFETENGVIHINQGQLPGTSQYAVMTANTGLGSVQKWKITFEYRVGTKRHAGTWILLSARGTRVAQAGADVFGPPVLVVGDKTLVKLENNDQAWHQVCLNCIRGQLTTTLDGKEVDRAAIVHPPDLMEIGTRNPNSSQQTELWVRDIIVGSASDAQASSETGVSSSITDTFAAGPLQGLWNLKPNGGSITKRGNEVQFLPSKGGDSFGIMTSRNGMLPAGSSWKVQARFRYLHRGPYGVGLGVQTVAVPKQQPLAIVPDHPKIDALVALGGKVHPLANPSQWHDLVIDNMAGHWTVFIDGLELGQADVPQGDYELYFGNDQPHLNPWEWSTLALQSVRIDYTDGPSTPWLADVLKTQSRLVGKLTVSPSITGNGAVVLPEITKKVSSLGLALGVDSRIQAPAFPAPDGHLVVTARTTLVQLQRGSIVEFRPQLNRPDYTPAVLHLVVNHRIVESKDVFFTRSNRSLPSFVVDAPTTGTRSTLVSIVAEDVNQRQIELSSATLVLAASDAPNSFVLQDEKVRLTATKEQTPKAIYAFLENEYLGCLKVNLESFVVDARHLPVGQHRFWLITESSDGALHLPTDSTITIVPRFKMSSFAQEGTFTVDADKQSIPVHIHREAGTGVSKSYLYVAGAFIGESEKADFDMAAPVTEVSSGNITIEAVGVGKDGSLYPPESIHINLKNVYTDSAAASSRKYKDLQGVIAQIGAIDQEIEYWYTRACNEPDFVTFTSGKEIVFYDGFFRVASVAYIDSITVPGMVGDYLGRCKAAIIKRAQLRLEIGRRYKELGKGDAARSSLQQAIQEAGEDSGIGTSAVQELRGL